MSSNASTSRAHLAGVTPARWQVRLLGAVEAFDGAYRIERFPSRAVAALLARLALAPGQAHARETLVELLWPGVTLSVGRNRLRQALSTLKSLLEPAGVPGNTVLQADRLAVRVVRDAIACDAVDFERLARSGRVAQAQALYGGEFMPGHYDEWVDEERQRLAALHEGLAQVPTPAPAPAAAVTASGVPADPSRALRLPRYLTRLFGAEAAIGRLRAQVLEHRLVTLLGAGGSGKTRLGVELALALQQAPPGTGTFDRIAFVSLVTCDDATGMLDAIASAFQLPGADSTAALAQALAGQRVLMVLDNFEQLVGRAEGVVADLVSRLPDLHLLVTSRRALGLDGETMIAAEPLALPAPDAPLAAAAANAAVALFVDRARAARADFHLSARNQGGIAALVRALHGMPLAIELAASRVRSFAPAQMLALLAAGEGGHLAMLTRGGPRSGHDARHASMAQVIAWSWRLLDAPAQRTLVALTLFPADASAAAVAAVDGDTLAATAARLDDLVAHSLVRASAGDEARFSLVEPVREYAAAQAGDLAAQRARLRRWLVGWAQALGPAAAPARVAPELASIHAVLAGAAADGAPQEALTLVLALRNYWETDGLPGRLLPALEQALQALPISPQRAQAHELLAYLRFEAGFVSEARAHADAAVAAAGADPSRRAHALVRRAWVDIAVGRAADRASPRHTALQGQLEEALALASACGDVEARARALHQLGVLTAHVHASAHGADMARAEALFEQSQTLWLALGDRRKAYARLRNRAQCWRHLGRSDEAMAAYRRCEQVALEDGDWVGQIDSLISMSALLADSRQWQAALDTNRRCLALCWQRWHRHGLGYALWNPPRLLARLRQPEPAMRLMGFAATFWTSLFGPLGREDQRYLRRVRRLVALQLGAARAQSLWLEGAAMDVASAVRLALAA